MPSVRVTKILSDLAVGPGSLESAPQQLVLACAAALPVTGVGLVLMTNSGPAGVVAASDGPAQVMEDLQFTLGEGPCVDSSRSGRPVLLTDLSLTGPPRWPAFSAGALEAGIRAIFALPLRVGGIRLGVLDLYRDRAGALNDDELASALDFADAAAAILLHLQALAASDDGGPGTIGVIEDRAEVHQATGVIAVQAGVTLAQALVLLRARTYADDTPIIQLARQVLTRRVRFDVVDAHDIREH